MSKENKPINPISFTDKPVNPITFVDEEKVIDPEDRTYLVLYYAEIDGKDEKSFEIIEGRTKTYDFIKSIAEYLDMIESKVLVNNVTLEDALSIYEFMKIMETHYNDGFDIMDYVDPEDIKKFNIG